MCLVALAACPAGATPVESLGSSGQVVQSGDLEVRVESVLVPDRPERVRPPLPAVPLGGLPGVVELDGRFEPAWARVPVAPPPRSQINQAPPDPAWQLQAALSPQGLAFALHGIDADTPSTISIDPDGSRRGWVAVHLGPEPTLQRCFAGPEHTQMPVLRNWRAYSWPCSEPVPARAAAGPDGWELVVPWDTLGTTTDDLRLQWLVRTREATAAYDKRGVARDYPGGSRPVVLDPENERVDVVVGHYDVSREVVTWSLRGPRLDEPESWTVRSWWNGKVYDQVTVSLGAERGRARAEGELSAPTDVGLYVVATRDTDEPLRPGSSYMIWRKADHAALATPVHDGRVQVRLALGRPAELEVRLRRVDGAVLGSTIVDVPRGQHRLYITVPESWPDELELDVGGLFAPDWLTVLRAPGGGR